MWAGKQKPQWQSKEREWRDVGFFETARWAGSTSNNFPFSFFPVAPLREEREDGSLGWGCFSVNGATSLPLTDTK